MRWQTQFICLASYLFVFGIFSFFTVSESPNKLGIVIAMDDEIPTPRLEITQSDLKNHTVDEFAKPPMLPGKTEIDVIAVTNLTTKEIFGLKGYFQSSEYYCMRSLMPF